MLFPSRLPVALVSVFVSCGLPCGAAHPSQGLWVGEVALNQVNEATGAVGDSNTYEFSDPKVPTPTSDTAFLRLIVHVNGAGQASLLKSVAVVDGAELPDGTRDIVLLTDPALYSQYPGVAKRIASAFFDFGDQQAVGAVRELIDTATEKAVLGAKAGLDQAAVQAAVGSELANVVSQADVDAAYLDRGAPATSFLTKADGFFTETEVETIADKVAELIDGGTKTVADFAHDPTAGKYAPFDVDPLLGRFSAAVDAADLLRTGSFYGDTRGTDAIVGVVTAAAEAAAGTPSGDGLAGRKTNARRAAVGARHNAADLEQGFNRFLSGSTFESLRFVIPPAAAQAALASHANGDSESEITTAVKAALLAQGPVGTASQEAATVLAQSLWGDPRAQWAFDDLVNGASEAAAASVMVSQIEGIVRGDVESAVEGILGSIRSGPVFATAPSGDYSDFVTESDYQSAADTAASDRGIGSGVPVRSRCDGCRLSGIPDPAGRLPRP